MQPVELERGMRGFQVRTAQNLLNQAMHLRPPLKLDGEFGPLTDRAVRGFQKRQQIEVDGVVGRETWGRLGAVSRPVARPSISPGPAAVQAPTALKPRVPAPVAAKAVTPPRGSQPPRRSARSGSGTSLLESLELMARAAPDAPWMRTALAEYGVSEVRGRTHNSRVIEYHGASTLRAQTDEVPWCASFVNWVLREAGLRGTGSAAAASFSDWGTPVDPRFGCVVHIRRAQRGHDGATGSSSGNHVAFLVDRSASHVRLLGGNQGNQVKLSTFSLAGYSIRACRWPKR